ncbi:uncharacterized protein GGS22DRAFT_150069, partial [Annulohypoxylon maeteangense]|uniref:uncharacterized protein n=1 Tax=Annulohypoxylon maeteangense TaxID=1927788 RepID=UPI002008D15D
MMAYSNFNYFTCTLGHAAHLKEESNDQRSSKTVLELIDTHAIHIPGLPALGFANYNSDTTPHWPPDHVTFSELCALSKIAARNLAKALHVESKDVGSPTIGLLCASSLNFVSAWLGLMRLGCKPFLL